MKQEYLYNCKGCNKPDKEHPDKEIECDWCGGFGKVENEWCPNCDGKCKYVPRTRVEHHQWARCDAYGIYTGLYCDKCFKDNYPYRTDRYFDESYAGERLEEDY